MMDIIRTISFPVYRSPLFHPRQYTHYHGSISVDRCCYPGQAIPHLILVGNIFQAHQDAISRQRGERVTIFLQREVMVSAFEWTSARPQQTPLIQRRGV